MAGACLQSKIWLYMPGPSRGEGFSSEPQRTGGDGEELYLTDYHFLSLLTADKTAKKNYLKRKT